MDICHTVESVIDEEFSQVILITYLENSYFVEI